MEHIFHERQEGSLCAQHCLNSLLQSDYYTADVLSDLAKDLDHSEHILQPGNCGDPPSSNCDDSGFFSVQVLQTALRVWNIELLPFRSSEPICKVARDEPCTQKAFICNFREHWFTIRRLSNQWFNLNSLLAAPELLSDTHLGMFLIQLLHEGYSIFVVHGELPDCPADHMMRLSPVVPVVESKYQSSGASTIEVESHLQLTLPESRKCQDSDDASLKKALALSLQDATSSASDEVLLDEAIKLSMEDV
jgi:ataxin-3